VVEDRDVEDVIRIMMNTAKTQPEGEFGDGKIFVSEVEEAYTVSSGKKEL